MSSEIRRASQGGTAGDLRPAGNVNGVPNGNLMGKGLQGLNVDFVCFRVKREYAVVCCAEYLKT